MYLIAFPLLLIPFALYNMIIFLLNMPFSDTVFSIPLMSERRMPVTTGDLLLVVAMLRLYVEVVKAASPSLITYCFAVLPLAGGHSAASDATIL